MWRKRPVHLPDEPTMELRVMVLEGDVQYVMVAVPERIRSAPNIGDTFTGKVVGIERKKVER